MSIYKTMTLPKKVKAVRDIARPDLKGTALKLDGRVCGGCNNYLYKSGGCRARRLYTVGCSSFEPRTR